MQYIRTKINVLYKYKCAYVLLTILNKYIFFHKTLISMVDCHGEKTTKHFDQCGSHNDKNNLYFGGLGQITDTITRLIKFQQTVVTFALTV